MTGEEEARSKLARDLLDALAELNDKLDRLTKLVERHNARLDEIAQALGIAIA